MLFFDACFHCEDKGQGLKRVLKFTRFYRNDVSFLDVIKVMQIQDKGTITAANTKKLV